MRSRRGRSSKYKPLVIKRVKRLSRKVKVKDQKLPNINPSLREIWKIMSDGRIIYRKNNVIGNIDDECLDMESTLPDLVHDSDFTFEEIIQVIHFLPSLLNLCKAQNIEVRHVPIMPSLEDYKKWRENGEDF